jgi:hypothetical protein
VVCSGERRVCSSVFNRILWLDMTWSRELDTKRGVGVKPRGIFQPCSSRSWRLERQIADVVFVYVQSQYTWKIRETQANIFQTVGATSSLSYRHSFLKSLTVVSTGIAHKFCCITTFERTDYWWPWVYRKKKVGTEDTSLIKDGPDIVSYPKNGTYPGNEDFCYLIVENYFKEY